MPASQLDLPGTDLIDAGLEDLERGVTSVRARELRAPAGMRALARRDVIRRFMEELAAEARADGRAYFRRAVEQTFA